MSALDTLFIKICQILDIYLISYWKSKTSLDYYKKRRWAKQHQNKVIKKANKQNFDLNKEKFKIQKIY